MPIKKDAFVRAGKELDQHMRCFFEAHLSTSDKECSNLPSIVKVYLAWCNQQGTEPSGKSSPGSTVAEHMIKMGYIKRHMTSDYILRLHISEKGAGERAEKKQKMDLHC